MRLFSDKPDGYMESIRKGSAGVSRFRGGVYYGSGDRDAEIERLRKEIETAGAIIIGAGAGLSTSAGLTYSGERFEKYFPDFADRFGIEDMYSGGFYPFPDNETRWAWWARHIYFNRYIDPPKPVYRDLLELVRDKDYFVITTNVDHQFQKADFDKNRLFYTQGDYGLFQTADGRNGKTYDNEEWVMRAMEAQGFVRDDNGVFQPVYGKLSMRIPSELTPRSPEGRAVAMNLRADDTFVQDEGWYEASANYSRFLKKHESGHVLYLELGVGANTPVIIKFPFWTMVHENPDSVYACLNYREAYAPKQISERSIIIDGDIGEVLAALKK
jgi:NAD-dependent SIR2 family protein deacetylase